VLSLEQAKPKAQQWHGPIRSAFGLHYVWVNAVEPRRNARLDEVEQQLRNDFEYAAQAKALQNATAALRTDYDAKGLDVKELASKRKEVRQ
jgi:hypothetical protein